jgi:hypothetical protein
VILRSNAEVRDAAAHVRQIQNIKAQTAESISYFGVVSVGALGVSHLPMQEAIPTL